MEVRGRLYRSAALSRQASGWAVPEPESGLLLQEGYRQELSVDWPEAPQCSLVRRLQLPSRAWHPLRPAMDDRSFKFSMRVTRTHRVPGGHEVRAHGQSHSPYANEPDTRHLRPSSRAPKRQPGVEDSACARPLTGRRPSLVAGPRPQCMALSGSLGCAPTCDRVARRLHPVDTCGIPLGCRGGPCLTVPGASRVAAASAGQPG